MVKHKIFKYFFLEFVKLFLLISLSLSILIWMTQAARLLELVTEFGNPISVYLKFVFYSYAKILDNIFILCYTITLFFLISKLESSYELNIYWLSGVSKKKIIKAVLLISLIAILVNIFLSAILAPWSSLKGREALSKSKFSLVNSLVKEQNFNSPLEGLTIYVNENDNNGNLNGVFIYEKTRTIIAEKGEVLSNNDGSYLKLFNGTTQEKENKNINIINFESTIFDFSKYELQNVTFPKFNERSIFWLFKNKNTNIAKTNEVREEINKRLIKPFLILALSVLACFLLYTNNEKVNLKKLKLSIYFLAINFIILNQILLGISGNKIIFSLIYIIIIFLIFIFSFYILISFIKNEGKWIKGIHRKF